MKLSAQIQAGGGVTSASLNLKRQG